MIRSRKFVELDKNLHDRVAFDCGVDELNEFIWQFASRHREAGISKTMVLPAKGARDGKKGICAFYTLAHTEIERESLPASLARKLPRYPVPVMLLAQLAVHKELQRRGLGKTALICALRQCLAIHAHLPSYAVVVDAISSEASFFYEQYGFHLLDSYSGGKRLYLPMKTIQKLF